METETLKEFCENLFSTPDFEVEVPLYLKFPLADFMLKIGTCKEELMRMHFGENQKGIDPAIPIYLQKKLKALNVERNGNSSMRILFVMRYDGGRRAELYPLTSEGIMIMRILNEREGCDLPIPLQ